MLSRWERNEGRKEAICLERGKDGLEQWEEGKEEDRRSKGSSIYRE